MTEFDRHLQTAPIKAEALGQAQMAMNEGKYVIEGVSYEVTTGACPCHPPGAKLGNENREHPYYWAAFTMLSSPW